MKRLFKALGWLILILVVLVAGAALIIPRVVDPNDYKETIAQAVADKTGRQLVIEGDLALSIFPWLGVDVGRIRLGQPPNLTDLPFPADAPFLSAERTRVRVKLLPLLSSRVEMDRVAIEGLAVNLGRTASGEDNWSDLLTQSGEGSSPSGQSFAVLAVGGLDVTGATVVWHDVPANRRYRISNGTLHTGAVDLSLKEPISVDLALALEAQDSALPGGALGAQIRGRSSLALSRADQTLSANGLELAAVARDPNDQQIELQLQGALRYSLASGQLTTSQLSATTKTAGYQGTAADVVLTLTDATATPDTGTYEAAKVSASGSLSGAAVGGASVNFDAATKASLTNLSEGGALSLTGLTVDVPNFEREGTSGQANLKADVTGDLTTQRFALRQLTATVAAAGAQLAGGSADLALAGDLDVDVKNLVASSPALTINAKRFDIAGYAGSAQASAALAADPDKQRFHATGLKAEGTLDRGTGFTGPLPFVAAGDVSVDLAKNLIDAPSLQLESSAFDVDAAKGSIALALTGAKFQLDSGALRATSFSTKGLINGKAAFKGNVDLDLSGTGISADSTAVVMDAFRLRLPGLAVDGNKGTLDASGRLRANLQQNNVRITGLKAKGKLVGAALKGGRAAFNGSTNASYDLRSQAFQLDKLNVNLNDFDYEGVRGALNLSGNVIGNPGTAAYTMKGFRAKGNVAGKMIPGRKTDIDIQADGTANLKADTVRLSRLVARALGLEVEGNVNVDALSTAPTYRGALAIAAFNPRPVMRRFGLGTIQTQDKNALRRVAARANVLGGPGRISLKKLVLSLDDTTAQGDLSATGLKSARPTVNFNLKVDGINADRYAPPASKQKRKGPPPGALPIAMLTTVNLDGKLQIGKLKMNNIRVSNFRMTAKGKDRLLTLDPMSANLYRGTLKAKGTVDTSAKTPRITVTKSFRSVQAGPLLRDLNGKAALTGTADFDINVRTQGLSEQQLLRNANGKTSFELRDGTIEGVNMAGEICNKLRRFGIVSQAAGNNEQTPFSRLGGTGDIRKGTVYNNDMAMTSPFLRVAGAGNIQLPTQIVGYAVTAHIVDSCGGQGRGVVSDLVDIPIPIRITGPVAKPRYGFDYDRLFESLASKQGSRLLEKALGRGRQDTAPGSAGAAPKDGTQQVIEGLLKGILKR